MGICKTQGLNREAKYYFNDIDEVINGSNSGSRNLNQNISMEQRVSLNCTMKNVDSTNEYQIELIIYSDSQRKAYKSAGLTDKRNKNEENIISFERFFVMPYLFERQQLIDFKISYGGQVEVIQTSLGSIMGSRKQTFKKSLQDGSEFMVEGREIKKSNKIITINLSLMGNLTGMELGYSLTDLGTNTKPKATKLYDSEIKKGHNLTQLIFSECSIPSMFFNSKENTEESNISIDIKDLKHKTNLGNYKGPISKLITSESNEIALSHNKKAIIKCCLLTQPSFISYLRSGMNINLTIGIDFTGSNGAYTHPFSLHYLQNGLNDYEKAIRKCGDILAYYDDDQLFPVFGFGFKFKDDERTQNFGEYNLFNFPVNNNISDPNIHLIDNVLKEYRNFITKIVLWGPTKFAPMINDLNSKVKKDLSKGLTMHYNIILILTDGQINDMPETIDALVEASFLPISVIIVGIGKGDFSNMDILDADDNPLYDKNGRKADRDLVQFVPFYRFKDDAEKLAEQVLEEIPRQVVEYYQHKGISPIEEEEEEIKKDNINNINEGDAPPIYKE